MLRNDTVPDEGVIRKIQNLLELAKHATANENEAATAMMLAQQLLARYNLELQTVMGTKVANGASTVEEKRAKNATKYRAAYAWQRKLWESLASTNFCAMWIEVGEDHYASSKNYPYGRTIKGDRIVLLGKESNVKTVQLMGEYIIDTINRLLPYPSFEHMSRSAHSWREGCMDRLAERMEEKFEQMKQDDSAHDAAGYTAAPGTAMVVRGIYEQEKAANYDAQNGDGAWARMKQRDAEWAAGYDSRMVLRKEREDAAAAKIAAERALESAEAKAKREVREAKEAEKQCRRDERWSDTYWRQQERAGAKRDHRAYDAGQDAGSDIGLHGQVSGGKAPRQLS